MCWELQLKLDPCDTDSEMLSTHTKAPSVTFSTWMRGRVTPSPHCGGDVQKPLAVWCSLEDISLLSVPFSSSLSSSEVPHMLTYECEKPQPYPFWNYCPGCISRFKKITDNKSSSFPLCIRWYLHFPFFLIHFILWFISHAEAKLFKIQKTWQFPAVIKGLQFNCYLSL